MNFTDGRCTCGCKPGTEAGGWHEKRSAACLRAERAAWASIPEAAKQIAADIRAGRLTAHLSVPEAHS